MKIDSRLRNKWFWAGLLGLFFSTTHVDPTTVTSWSTVYTLIVEMVSNPFLLVSFIFAVIGQWNNPTTKGLGD